MDYESRGILVFWRLFVRVCLITKGLSLVVIRKVHPRYSSSGALKGFWNAILTRTYIMSLVRLMVEIDKEDPHVGVWKSDAVFIPYNDLSISSLSLTRAFSLYLSP